MTVDAPVKTYRFVNQAGEEQQIPLERWMWIAEYEDGSELRQFDDRDGTFHQVAEIDHSRLVVLRLACTQRDLPEVRVFQIPGRRLVHFYLNTCLEANTPREQKYRQYCIGFEIDAPETEKGKREWLAVVNPDDSVSVEGTV